ncbi:AGAP008742-PA [Sergentomyia squamirostris]
MPMSRGESYEWVGWRNDTFGGGAGKPVEMVFEFDTVRNFTSMLLHTNNMFSKDVQVFVRASVFFSVGGQHFSGQPVQYSYMPDSIMESARDVTVKLHNRIGKYLQVHLYFALRWIMLSEVSFVSSEYYKQFHCAIFTPPTLGENSSSRRPAMCVFQNGSRDFP